MSHRREQLASSLQRTIGQLIAQGLNDPRVRGMISVTSVKLSPDNRYADVLVSVLPATAEKLSIEGLQSAAGHLRATIGQKLRLRSVPHLRFEADTSIKKQSQVFGAIRKAMDETTPPGEEGSS